LGSTISLIFLNERSEFRKILRLQAPNIVIWRAIPSPPYILHIRKPSADFDDFCEVWRIIL
jgi:hypothetical protein